MTKNDRRTKKLLGMLQLHKRLELKEVVEVLEISEATARRLFAQLEKEGKILRIRGGIQIVQQLGYDYSYQALVSHRSHEKSIIGKAAAELVENNDRIFLDAGTTVLHLAETLSVKIQAGDLQNIVPGIGDIYFCFDPLNNLHGRESHKYKHNDGEDQC